MNFEQWPTHNVGPLDPNRKLKQTHLGIVKSKKHKTTSKEKKKGERVKNK